MHGGLLSQLVNEYSVKWYELVQADISDKRRATDKMRPRSRAVLWTSARLIRRLKVACGQPARGAHCPGTTRRETEAAA